LTASIAGWARAAEAIPQANDNVNNADRASAVTRPPIEM